MATDNGESGPEKSEVAKEVLREIGVQALELLANAGVKVMVSPTVDNLMERLAAMVAELAIHGILVVVSPPVDNVITVTMTVAEPPPRPGR